MFATKTLRASLLTLGTLAALAIGCDAPISPTDLADADARGPIGKADAAGGSCATADADACGARSADGCWCDDACVDYGDCCPDVEPVCGIGEAPECPDADDPDIHWVSHEVLECAAIFFACDEGQELFSDECGCGCIGDAEEPICPAADDPAVHYISQNPLECTVILFGCEDNQTGFTDDCGCGCIDQPEPLCPDPEDPAVHYISQKPLECAAILFGCADDQTQFTDDCGCGCIDA